MTFTMMSPPDSVWMYTVLLMGGTADTAPVAKALLSKGLSVIVTTVSDYHLALPTHPYLRHRVGSLGVSELKDVLVQEGVSALVSATHPYASEARKAAALASSEAGVPYFPYLRDATLIEDGITVRRCANHQKAAIEAFSFGRGVLVTVGSRNIDVYGREALRTGIPWAARVLPMPESVDACLNAGLPRECIIAEQGPFSEADTRRHLRTFYCSVLVTKDGGISGGTREKLAAAKAENCCVVLVERPHIDGKHYNDPEALANAVAESVTGLRS